MNIISKNSIADVKFHLNWKSADSVHSEFYYGESLKSREDMGGLVIQTPYTTAQRAIVGSTAYDEFDTPVLYSGVVGLQYTRTPTSPYYGPVLPRFNIASKKQAANIGALVRCFF